MSIAKVKDLRNMSADDVQKKLGEVQAELIRQKGKRTSGGAPENPGRMKELRRTVARIITIQKEMGKTGEKTKPKEIAKKELKEKPKLAEKKEEKPAEGKK